jgi:hypothetical protein
MKKQHQQKKQNPTPFNLNVSIRFWRKQSITECLDRGGSFNVQLYLDYLEIINQTT